MKNYLYILFILCCFSSCKKEEKKHIVSYKIVVLSGNPNYSVSYASTNNSTKTEGPITASSWTSPAIDDKKDGSSAYLKLEGGGGCSYKMFIYIDGGLEKEERMDDPYGPKSIEAVIRD
jgi:hypothetical protein